VESLKCYLEDNIKYPPKDIKNASEGSMIISFKVNKHKMIDDICFIRHLTNECDSEVVKTLKKYPQTILLPPDEYTIGLKFFLIEDGEPDSEMKPFNKSAYKNFLFELNVINEFLMLKRRDTSY